MEFWLKKTWFIFVFVNDDKVKVFAVLQAGSEEDMQIYHHLDDYFEEVNRESF